MGAVLALAGAAAAPPVGAAVEPGPTLCSEVEGAYFFERSHEGDLVADVDCGILRGVVHGDVTVLPGVRFSVGRASVDGDVEVAGHLQLADGGISGDVTLTSPETASLEVWFGDGGGGTIWGDVTGEAAEVLLDRAEIWGAYDVTVRDATRVRGSSELLGPVTARGGRLLVHEATFYDGLTSTGSHDVVVCRATVARELRVSDLTDYARVGVEGNARCRVRVSGSLVLVDNPHSIDLGSVRVTKDLVCTGNTGPRGITGTDRVVVQGNRTGQCAP